ncbi:MAG: cation diffusion facilitator family transporter [Lachnospiraceae bacterium]
MITYLINKFIPNKDNVTSPDVRQSYGILCGIAGIGFNLLLFLCKLFAGLLSGSISIMADAFNNLSDAGSSVITLIGFKISGQKPDLDHPFGHGRVEYISGLFVSIAIIIMALELLKSSISKIIHPNPVIFSPIIILILLLSICVKCYMALYNKKIGQKISSAAMKATATDSLSDTLATTVVLLGTLFTHFTGICIDGYCGVLVGLFILYAGICAAKETISPLLGQMPEPEFVHSIEHIVLNDPAVLGIHDLVVHNYGPGRIMISLHAEVPASGDILLLHDAIDNIEHQLRQDLNCNAVIHMDPIQDNDEETLSLKEQVETLVMNIDPSLRIHDFRIVKGPTHTNIIFDVVVPYDFKLDDLELKQSIAESLKHISSSYFAVIEVDHAYVLKDC